MLSTVKYIFSSLVALALIASLSFYALATAAPEETIAEYDILAELDGKLAESGYEQDMPQKNSSQSRYLITTGIMLIIGLGLYIVLAQKTKPSKKKR